MRLHSLLAQDLTVLTASRRLAHAIRLGYARYAQQQGWSVWRTPQVLPWTTWLRQQYLESRSSALTGSSGARVLTASQARVLWDDIVGDSALASDLLNPASAARSAARSWRSLQDYLIPLERLQAFATPEAQALHTWSAEFEHRCAALGAIDETQLAHWADQVGFVPDERVALAGFDVVTPAMARLLERWRARDKLIEVSDASEPGAVTLLRAPDRPCELTLAAHWARDRMREGATNVGVILPDLATRRTAVSRAFEDAIAPALRHTGSPPAPLPLVIAAPEPMSAYPLVDAALLVLQLAAGGASSIDAGRLLRSPFIAGGESERGVRALADVRLRDEQRERWDWFKLERWAAICECEQLQLAAREINTLIRAAQTQLSASEWAQRFNAMWLAIGWPGDRTLDSVEHQTLIKLQGVLAQLGTLDAVTAGMSLQRALSLLHTMLVDTPFEPETLGAAITVIDATTSAGMHFDALWVAGLDADRWPAATNPDPLIPLELQRAAGIPEASASSALALAELQLRRWTSSAREVVLSWPAQDGDMQLNRSPLLSRLGLLDVQAAEVPSAALRRVIFDARPTLERLQDDRAPMLPSQLARGGARILELQSRCAFRAQAELRLRAPPMPRVSLGVEPVDRGTILHRVLADVWRHLLTQERLRDSDDKALETFVRDSARRHATQALAPETQHGARLVTLEIEYVVRQCLRLLNLEKLRPPFAVRFAEAAEQFSIGGLSITLQPDRLDLLPGGGELLIDYKLGDSHQPRDWFEVLPGRPRRPQLPLYGLARAAQLRALAYVVLAPGAVEYRGWSDGADVGPGVLPYPQGVRIDLGDPVDWESLLHYWRFMLTQLAERYVAGDAQVDPLPQECATCHLSTLCRIHERVAAERLGESSGDE